MQNWGPGLCHTIHRMDNIYLFGLSVTQNRRAAHIFLCAREVEKFGNVLAEKKIILETKIIIEKDILIY